MNPTPTTPKLPEPATGEGSLTVVAHAATDWMRSITETELALIPNVGADGGRRDRCRMLYRIPLVRLSDARALAGEVERLRAEVAALTADAERYRWLRDMSEWEPFDASWLCQQDIYGQFPADMDAALDASRALATQEAKS